jgi:hypothetical protein
MAEKFIRNRILGTVDIDTDEAQAQVKQKLKLAASGAYPYVIREMMKKQGWKILSSDAREQDKENAKLLICYAWWARALEGGIPKKYFEEFMLDHLEYLEQPDNKGSGDELVLDKWKKYG